MADSPESSLSDLTSFSDLKNEEHEREWIFSDRSDHHSHHQEPSSIRMPPNKRQRVDSTSHHHRPSFSNVPPYADETETDISSDTDGDVPESPTTTAELHRGPGNSQLHDEDAYGHEQVTVCHWDGCHVGDLGNMDSLVEHIHDDHIGTRQKKYACEWDSCSRKGMPHASGYALRAHMRSHTKEKPFFCQLPECDRSFTRSDALAKHMRTVHETEALRPSDPVPRNHSNPPPRLQRLKLILSARPPDDSHRRHGDSRDHDLDILDLDSDKDDGVTRPRTTSNRYRSSSPEIPAWPSDVHFSSRERALAPSELFRLLRRQLHWAEEERQELTAEVERLEEQKKDEWLAKEALLEDVLETETTYNLKRPRELAVKGTGGSSEGRDSMAGPTHNGAGLEHGQGGREMYDDRLELV